MLTLRAKVVDILCGNSLFIASCINYIVLCTIISKPYNHDSAANLHHHLKWKCGLIQYLDLILWFKIDLFSILKVYSLTTEWSISNSWTSVESIAFPCCNTFVHPNVLKMTATVKLMNQELMAMPTVIWWRKFCLVKLFLCSIQCIRISRKFLNLYYTFLITYKMYA